MAFPSQTGIYNYNLCRLTVTVDRPVRQAKSPKRDGIRAVTTVSYYTMVVDDITL